MRKTCEKARWMIETTLCGPNLRLCGQASAHSMYRMTCQGQHKKTKSGHVLLDSMDVPTYIYMFPLITVSIKRRDPTSCLLVSWPNKDATRGWPYY